MGPQDQRDELFEKAKVGEITGEKADAEAIRLGLDSLSHVPSPNEFRPEALPHWTIPMAVAWLCYRNLEKVRQWSAPYREACLDWHWQRWRVGLDGPTYEGWRLETRSKPTFALLGLEAIFEGVERGVSLTMSAGDSRKALWVALQQNFFWASGIDLHTGRRVEIPVLDWHELVPVQGHSEVDEVRRGLLGTGYRDVLIPSATLRRLWPEAKTRSLELPPLMPPEGDGYMPLYCAAQWIATKGGSRNFDPESEDIWREAFDVLMAAIASKKVTVLGRRNGERERVPEIQFVDCPVFYPFADPSFEQIAGQERCLQSLPYWVDEKGRGELDDELTGGFGHQWTRLVVAREDIRREWRFAVAEPSKTGAPGRPTSMYLVLAEFERRACEQQLEGRVGDQAKVLASWFMSTNPNLPPVTAKTIANRISGRFRQLSPK